MNMKARLNKPIRVKAWFFKGKRLDRAGVLARVLLDGFTVTLLPSPNAKLLPSDGEQWVVVLEGFWAFNPSLRTATALCTPRRRIHETPMVARPRVPGFEAKLRRAHAV